MIAPSYQHVKEATSLFSLSYIHSEQEAAQLSPYLIFPNFPEGLFTQQAAQSGLRHYSQFAPLFLIDLRIHK